MNILLLCNSVVVPESQNAIEFPFYNSCNVIILGIEDEYDGPQLEDGKVTLAFMKDLMELYLNQKKLHRKFCYKVIEIIDRKLKFFVHNIFDQVNIEMAIGLNCSDVRVVSAVRTSWNGRPSKILLFSNMVIRSALTGVPTPGPRPEPAGIPSENAGCRSGAEYVTG